MSRRFRTLLAAVAVALIFNSSFARGPLTLVTASIDVARHKEPLPADLAAPVAALLNPGDGARVTFDKDTTLDFWWVKALPASTGSGPITWANVEEGTLVGAVRVSADFRDIRGRVVKPGTYTLRYGIQPQDGDHLGVSPFREFLLLSPAALDTEAPPRGHEGTVEISKRTIGGSHPAVLSIDPPLADPKQAPLSTHKTELDHDAVIFEVPVARDGTAAESFRFGLVLVGRIEG